MNHTLFVSRARSSPLAATRRRVRKGKRGARRRDDRREKLCQLNQEIDRSPLLSEPLPFLCFLLSRLYRSPRKRQRLIAPSGRANSPRQESSRAFVARSLRLSSELRLRWNKRARGKRAETRAIEESGIRGDSLNEIQSKSSRGNYLIDKKIVGLLLGFWRPFVGRVKEKDSKDSTYFYRLDSYLNNAKKSLQKTLHAVLTLQIFLQFRLA